jgi:hypothetical protein
MERQDRLEPMADIPGLNDGSPMATIWALLAINSWVRGTFPAY